MPASISLYVIGMEQNIMRKKSSFKILITITNHFGCQLLVLYLLMYLNYF